MGHKGYVSISELFGDEIMTQIYKLIQDQCAAEEMEENHFVGTIVPVLEKDGSLAKILLKLGLGESHIEKLVTDLIIFAYDKYFSSFIKMNKPLNDREKSVYCGFKTYITSRTQKESLEYLIIAHRELISKEELSEIYKHHVTALYDFTLNDGFEETRMAS